MEKAASLPIRPSPSATLWPPVLMLRAVYAQACRRPSYPRNVPEDGSQECYRWARDAPFALLPVAPYASLRLNCISVLASMPAAGVGRPPFRTSLFG